MGSAFSLELTNFTPEQVFHRYTDQLQVDKQSMPTVGIEA
jgi:hypothetical protein